MNWGEIQIESLKKMFLNNEELKVLDLEKYKNDKKYRTYLYGMPLACNEAIGYILENGRPLIKYQKLKNKAQKKYILPDILSNFKRLYQIVCDGNPKPNWHIEGNNVLVIDNWPKDGVEITIYYEAYHDLIKENTSSSYSLELEPYIAMLIPLYIAGELYKDDDIQLSTMYMNEFMNQVSNISGKDFNPNPTEIVDVYGMEW